MVDALATIVPIISLVVGAWLGVFLTDWNNNRKWADMRKATYDLIATDLWAIGKTGFDVFFQLIEKSPKLAEFVVNLPKTHSLPNHPEAFGEYGPTAMVLSAAIHYPAWAQIGEVRHGDTGFIISLGPYTNTFYAGACKHIDGVVSNIRILIAIPGDMKVKSACIKFNQAAINLSLEVNLCTRPTNSFARNAPIQLSLNLLGAALALCDAFNEATTNRSWADRLHNWWLTGKYQ